MKFKVFAEAGFEIIEGTNAIIERGVLVIFGDDGLPQDAWNTNEWSRLTRVPEEYNGAARDTETHPDDRGNPPPTE